MAKSVLSPKGFGSKMYSRLPAVYRNIDVEQKHQLKRYFDSTDEATEPLIDEVNKFLTFYNPSTVDMKVIPFVFDSFGLRVFHGIPEPYLRNLLPMIGKLFARKGTYEVIEYLTSVITDAKVKVEAVTLKGANALFQEALFGRAIFGSTMKTRPGLIINIELAYGKYGESIPDEDQIRRIIKEFVPFYMLVTILYKYRYDEDANLIAIDDFVGDTVKYRTGEEAFITAKESGIKTTIFFRDKDTGILVRFNDEQVAVFMQAIFGKAVFGVSERFSKGNTAIFMRALFGKAIFDKRSEYLPYTYDWHFNDFIKEKTTDYFAVDMLEDLEEGMTSKPVIEDRNLFIKDDESVIVKVGATPDRLDFSRDRYLPKRSAIFEGGQPMGIMVFGVAQPNTSVDYTVDRITYNDGTMIEVVID